MDLKDKFQEVLNGADVTLNTLHEQLKIPKSFLHAIYNGEYEKLPARVYARGYLKQIIKYLNIDDELLQIYDEKIGNSSAENVGYNLKYEPILEVKKTGKNTYIFLTLFIFVIIIVVVIFLLIDFTPNSVKNNKELHLKPKTNKNISPQSSTLNDNMNVVQQSDNNNGSKLAQYKLDNSSSGEVKDNISNEFATKDNLSKTRLRELKIVATDKVWLRVWIDNKTIKTFILNNGDNRTVKGDRFFKIKLGNAGAVKLYINHKTYPFTGKKGMVKTIVIPLDNANKR